jgi:hypothetical protein
MSAPPHACQLVGANAAPDIDRRISPAPVAIFAYKRVAHLKRLFETLRQNAEFSATDIVIFVDGPKGEADASEVAKVREFAANTGLSNVRARISERNQGLRRSICAGVTAMCAEYGRVIVLEDDLITSPVLLRYFNTALDRYVDDTNVYSISAYIYDCPQLREFERALVLPLTNSWGWATWQRAWSDFKPDAKPDIGMLNSASFRNSFDLGGFYPLSALLRQAVEGRVDSWFIFWYLHIFERGGVTIYPPRRYVENYGLREGATHGSALNPYDLFAHRPPLLDRLVEFPEASRKDYWAMDVLKASREVTLHRHISNLGRIRRSLLRRGKSTSR